MEGGPGNDTYIFNRGDGQDTINECCDEVNTVRFGEGIAKEDIEFRRDNSDLIVTIKNSSDSIRIVDWFYRNRNVNINFAFPDGTLLTKEQINSLPEIKTITGTEGDDYLIGSYLDETFYGLSGNDTIYPGEGNDTVFGGDGDDYIMDYEGDDVLIGGKGNDYIDISSGAGEKTLVFNKGDGIDSIEPPSIWNIGSYRIKIKFGEGISKEDLRYLYKEGEGIFIGFNSTDEGILIKLWEGKYEPDYGSIGWREIYDLVDYFSIEFQDGSIVKGREIFESFIIKGTDNHDTIFGTNGDDVLFGNKGNDYLNGGAGNDLYIFNPGDGRDTVVDNDGDDILHFNTDEDKVVLFKDGDDLVVGYSQNDFVKVINQFKEDEYQGIERIQVKDGHYITRWDIENIVHALIDFNADQGMDYTQKYNDLINNSQFITLLSQSWQNTAFFRALT